MNKKNVLLVIIIFCFVIIGGVLWNQQRSSLPSPSKIEPTKNNAQKKLIEARITITSSGFVPATLQVKKGTVVVWINKDTAKHMVTSDPHPTHTKLPGLVSKELKKGEKYQFTFSDAGIFTYHDQLNPLKLQGTIVVVH